MKLTRDKKLLLKSLILALFLTSCATPYRSLLIETARPSSQLLPDKIRSLTLVNRSITGDFRNFNEDSIQQYFFDRGFKFDAVVLDSVAADTTLKALGELLFESGRYDVVIPEERNLDRNAKFYMVPESLDWDEVSRLCVEFNTDALLVIERFFNKIMTNYDINVYPQYATATIDSKYDAIVKIYDPLKKEIVKQLVVNDTISWQDADGSTKKLFARLPTIKECLIQTGIQIALDIDDRLSPNWVKETRIYFLIDDADASSISKLAREQRWQEAYDYWLTYSTSSKNSIKSKAEFNLALAAEMLGNLDLAIEWANKSYYTKYMNQTNNYLLKLKQRKQILERFQN